MYKENRTLFDVSHTSCMHNAKNLRKKSNAGENQRLWSSIKECGNRVLFRIMHECFINNKENFKLSKSMHSNSQEN